MDLVGGKYHRTAKKNPFKKQKKEEKKPSEQGIFSPKKSKKSRIYYGVFEIYTALMPKHGGGGHFRGFRGVGNLRGSSKNLALTFHFIFTYEIHPKMY